MRIWILLALLPLAALASGCGVRSDKDLLAELRNQSTPLDKIDENKGDKGAAKTIWKQRGETAKKLLEEFEKHHAQSPLLTDARVLAFQIFLQDSSFAAQAAEVAKALRTDAPKGSDVAARADLYLLNLDIQD